MTQQYNKNLKNTNNFQSVQKDNMALNSGKKSLDKIKSSLY
jgi:hypothetical protein